MTGYTTLWKMHWFEIIFFNVLVIYYYCSQDLRLFKIKNRKTGPSQTKPVISKFEYMLVNIKLATSFLNIQLIFCVSYLDSLPLS